MLSFLFRVGLVCYAGVVLRSLAVMIYLSEEGFERKKKRSVFKMTVDWTESFIRMQIPVYNVLVALVLLFASDKKLAQNIIDRGDVVKMEEGSE